LPEVWLKARTGNRNAMVEVIDRCAADVRITQKLFIKALDLNLFTGIKSYP
jgi:hypothetical protein